MAKKVSFVGENEGGSVLKFAAVGDMHVNAQLLHGETFNAVFPGGKLVCEWRADNCIIVEDVTAAGREFIARVAAWQARAPKPRRVQTMLAAVARYIKNVAKRG